ncbi:DUF2628 domain-containing protein [Nitratireductor basaltis]|uniref:DUF2628 domain-containing protein n=1 Tax=Nitratireductor basaltis TaxID=472175 RepID=A0A084U6B0_9HYPH|nr:DUF2628 domain-containing protein [Nitratireductor basaltis]KFB08496.1 hypothetical protein EL18_02747 [Nitratireductor basaltis]
MASYLVLEPDAPASQRGEEAIVLRDGFSLAAFLLTIFWFLWHRMWLEALAALVVALAATALGTFTGLPILGTLFSLLVSLLIGLEARNLRVLNLRRRGWRLVSVVDAANASEAELRYVAQKSESEHAPPAVFRPAGTVAGYRAPEAGSAAFGLLDYPRKG